MGWQGNRRPRAPRVLRLRQWRLVRRLRRVFRGGVSVAALAIVAAVIRDGSTLLHGAVETGGCRIAGVIDGDTVRAYCPGRGVSSIRLLGYDTPETYSPECQSEWLRGTYATWVLRGEILFAEDIALVFHGEDRYGRRLALLMIDGRNAADVMVGAGHARRYGGGRRQGWCGDAPEADRFLRDGRRP